MKATLKRLMCLMLAFALAAFVPGCAGTNAATSSSGAGEGADDGIDGNETTATAVPYSTQGSYTTTLASSEIDLSGLTDADVVVGYRVPDEEAAARNDAAIEVATAQEAASAEAQEASAQSSGSSVEPELELDLEEESQLIALPASVSDATANSATVTFTDEKASRIEGYEIAITRGDASATTFVEITYSDATLTAEPSTFDASAATHRVTLELAEGAFADNVGVEAIELAGSFSDMKVGSLSASGKNLTLELEGQAATQSTGECYDGVVNVAASALAIAAEDSSGTSCAIPAAVRGAYLDSTRFSFEDGKAHVALATEGLEGKLDGITEKDISFDAEGIGVESVERNGDATLELTLDVKGAADANSAAAALNDTDGTVGGMSFRAWLDSAHFYPVFDYVEANGDNLDFTVILYAEDGTFADALDSNQFSFDGDFENAQVMSINRTDGTTAELKLSVPANGQTADSVDMRAGITMAEGALVNDWGQGAEASSYVRDYSRESMGRAATGSLNDADISAIKDIVGGFGNTTFGTIKDTVSGVSTAASIGKAILEYAGVIQSQDAKLDRVLANQQTIIDIMQTSNREMNAKLDSIEKGLADQALSETNSNVRNLLSCCNELKVYFDKEHMALLKDGQGVQLSKYVDEANTYLKTDEDYAKFMLELTSRIKEAEKDPRSAFQGFTLAYNNLANAYKAIWLDMNKTGTANTLGADDRACSLSYNFDTLAYQHREDYRATIKFAMEEGLSYILLYQNFFTTNVSSSCQEQRNQLDFVNSYIDSHPVTKTENQIYCYTLGKSVWNQMVTNGNYLVYHDKANNSRTRLSPEETVAKLRQLSGRSVFDPDYIAKFTRNQTGASTRVFFDCSYGYDALLKRGSCPANATNFDANMSQAGNWTEDQRTRFVRKMTYATLEQELNAAGFKYSKDMPSFDNNGWGVVGLAFDKYSNGSARLYHTMAFNSNKVDSSQIGRKDKWWAGCWVLSMVEVR